MPTSAIALNLWNLKLAKHRTDASLADFVGKSLRVSPPPQEAKPPDAAEVLEQLRRVEASTIFANVQRQRKLLRFVVQKALRGLHDQLKGSVIASDLFDGNYGELRLLVRAVRAKLLDYYNSEGSSDQVRIEIPKKTYIPVFTRPPHLPGRAAAHPSGVVQAEVPPDKQIWNVPARNHFFTARDAYLDALREAFLQNTPAVAQPQAISGLGGIGKTQAAIEYAWRFRQCYQAGLWCVAESTPDLFAGLAGLAKRLGLAEKDDPDLSVAAEAMRNWLESHSGWLLILDNVTDPETVRPFAAAFSAGHVLITTQLHATGQLAASLELLKMEPDEGALFLLRRAKLLAKGRPLEAAAERDQVVARTISAELDGLPLALDQAAAFIEQTPSTPEEYLELYRAEGARLRALGGKGITEHPSVTTTFALSFASVAKNSPAAADLLRACAFLGPDDIPEEIFSYRAKEPDDKMAEFFNTFMPSNFAQQYSWLEAVRLAGKFSLIRRNANRRSLHIHCLVQEVIRDEMDSRTRHSWVLWAECALLYLFPKEEDSRNWGRWRRLFPHVRTVVRLVSEFPLNWISAPVPFLVRAAGYLNACGAYAEADQLYKRMLLLTEALRGDRFTANYLITIGNSYYARGRTEEAETLYRRVVGICDKPLPDDRNTVTTLHGLALLAYRQGRCEEAEAFFQRAYSVCERVLGSDDVLLASVLRSLGEFRARQQRYDEAEVLYRRALCIRESALGPEHPDFLEVTGDLAQLHYHRGRIDEAEAALQRSLAMRERALGRDHPRTSYACRDLAVFYHNTGRNKEAEELYKRAISILEKELPEGSAIRACLKYYAALLRKVGRDTEAERIDSRLAVASLQQ